VAYTVKEIYYTLQGEGARTGRAAVFCRFTGCNLWTGREADRATAACWFCDTDFVGTDGPGGGRFATAEALAGAIAACWRDAAAGELARPYVVFTGGEPLLQLDDDVVAACHRAGFEVAVETNGTVDPPAGIDWLTVSPKPGSTLVVTRGQELKLVHPHEIDPADVVGLDFEVFYLQPLDGPDRDANTARVLDYCRRHPRWRLSLQTHKLVGIP
jgi:7-carboxy-7-deazaguanine synthase